MTDQFDPVRFKRDQRSSWDAASAGWEKWWSVFEKAAQTVSDRLVAMAKVKPGDRVLDIATGTGEPAITAARAVGPKGQVIGIDQSAGMVAAARRRASTLTLHNVEYREGDAESLRIDERGFDAVLCRWGLMFVPDLNAAVRGIGEVLKPGGWLATAVWATADKVPMISTAGQRIRELAGLPPPPPGTPNPLSLADTKIVERALAAAGFRDYRVEPVMVNFEFDSAEAFLQCRRDISYDFGRLLDSSSPDLRRKLEEAVITEARRFVGPGGRMRCANESLLIAAHT